MNRSRLIYAIAALFALDLGLVQARQDPATAAVEAQRNAAAAQAEQQRQADIAAQQQIAIREKSIADMNRFLHDTNGTRGFAPTAAAELQSKFFEFRQSIPKFRAATDEYRWAVSLDAKLEKPLKNITAQTEVMLRYLSQAKMKHPQPDAAEFKDYSQAELMWETLNSAERIGTFLDLAVAIERQDVVEAKMMEFMYTLNGELLRLKWLTTHTKG